MKLNGVEIDFGPLEGLMMDQDVVEIMVNGSDAVFIERKGQLIEVPDLRFQDEQHLRQVADRILDMAGVGRDVNDRSPITDVRLPDGSRMNVVIPPVAVNGTALTIRRLFTHRLNTDDLIRFGTWTPEIVRFLEACVIARLNIVVSGGTGSGKTTVLNILTNMIPAGERIIAVQNRDELQIAQKHLVKLDSRPSDADGKGEVSIDDLIVNAMRMRPDRIVVGEVRAGEVMNLIQGMNTGHDGSMCSIHATSPRDALGRLETMVALHGISLPLLTIRQHMASAVHLIIQQERMRDGKRRMTKITEITGLEMGEVVTQDIFEFIQAGFEDGQVTGTFTPTGNVPHFLQRFEMAGIQLPDDFFTPKQ